MLIPIRCTGCSKPLAGLYLTYCTEVRKRKLNKSMDVNKVEYLTKEHQEKTIEGHMLDELGITHQCCRITFLTNA